MTISFRMVASLKMFLFKHMGRVRAFLLYVLFLTKDSQQTMQCISTILLNLVVLGR